MSKVFLGAVCVYVCVLTKEELIYLKDAGLL